MTDSKEKKPTDRRPIRIDSALKLEIEQEASRLDLFEYDMVALMWDLYKRNLPEDRATISENESTSEGTPSKELENNRPISTLLSELSDKLISVCGQRDYGPDTLGWYMRKLAEILSTVSVDDELALRFLSEAADIKVKVDGGSISITGSVGGKSKGKGADRRAENAAIREGMDTIRNIGAEYPEGESDSLPTGKTPRRKTR